MARHDDAARQQEKDRRQVAQHFTHWGVKTVVSLILALLIGAGWLAWKMLSAGSFAP